MAFDIFKTVTNRIIDELEKGTVPWQKPWVSSGSCVSHNDGRHYSLLNCMLLGQPGEYATFNQIINVGGKVKKGSKARFVVFWKPMKKDRKAADGTVILKPDGSPEQETYFILKYYNVFRIGSDTEGVNLKYTDPVKLPCVAKADEKAQRILDNYIKGSGVTLVHEEGDRNCYTPALDRITLATMDQFISTAEYYGTAFHEATHSTMGRLSRPCGTAFMGSEVYSKEELVAELGAAALVNYCGLETEKSFRNSASYIASWLKVLKDDRKFIVSAAGKAEKAVELILSYSPDETITTDEEK